MSSSSSNSDGANCGGELNGLLERERTYVRRVLIGSDAVVLIAGQRLIAPLNPGLSIYKAAADAVDSPFHPQIPDITFRHPFRMEEEKV